MNAPIDASRSSATQSVSDPRVTSAINYVWAGLGTIGLAIGIGVYNKLSEMNDTLIRAVSKLEVQGVQINELRTEVAKQRDELAAMRSQVYMLEGKTLRGIREMGRDR